MSLSIRRARKAGEFKYRLAFLSLSFFSDSESLDISSLYNLEVVSRIKMASFINIYWHLSLQT